MKRVIVCSLFCALSVHWACIFAQEPNFITSLPRTQRQTALAAMTSIEAELAQLANSWREVQTREAAAARSAEALALSLDTYQDDSAPLSFALMMAGFGSLDAEQAETALYEQRQLRWDSAVMLMDGKYSEEGGATQARRDEKLIAAGKSLRTALSSLGTARIDDALDYLEALWLLHPDCPQELFLATAALARLQEPAVKRDWLSIISVPVPLQLSEYADAELMIAGPFAAEFASLSRAVSTRKLLGSAVQTAALISWALDQHPGRIEAGLAPLPPLPSNSVSELSVFFRNLSALEDEDILRVLHHEAELSAAFSESASILWYLWTSDREWLLRFFNLQEQETAAFVRRIWNLTASAAAAPPIAQDADSPSAEPLETEAEAVLAREGVYRRAELLFAQLRAAKTDQDVLTALPVLAADAELSALFKRQERYRSELERLRSVRKAVLVEYEQSVTRAVLTGPLSRVLSDFFRSPQMQHSLEFKYLESEIDEYWYVAVSLKSLREDGQVFYSPIPPRLIAALYADVFRVAAILPFFVGPLTNIQPMELMLKEYCLASDGSSPLPFEVWLPLLSRQEGIPELFYIFATSKRHLTSLLGPLRRIADYRSHISEFRLISGEMLNVEGIR